VKKEIENEIYSEEIRTLLKDILTFNEKKDIIFSEVIKMLFINSSKEN
jgi:hypothetical protein